MATQMQHMPESHDIVIVGGAVMGSAIACHLAGNPDFHGRILVLEKDPSYRFCASALSAASIRQQFSTAINIEVSLYGIRFLREIAERLAVGDERPDIALREQGYLFLASPAGAQVLTENHTLQLRLGADILLLDPAALRERFPWLNTDGIVAGGYGRSGEGWFDGYALMQAFRRKARALGVEYRAAEAAALVATGRRVEAVQLSDGTRIGCGVIVNAAGTGAAALAHSLGVELPVRPRKRMIFTFECAEALPHCPLLIDPAGVYVRPEGTGFICGSAPPPDQDPDAGDFEVDHAFFDDVIWPALAARVPAFERIRPGRAWAGHYDMNLFDHNALVGRLPGYDNAYVANGFSGHGLQQSPAVGLALSELIVSGRYRTIDLTPFRLERIAEGKALIERNVV